MKKRAVALYTIIIFMIIWTDILTRYVVTVLVIMYEVLVKIHGLIIFWTSR